MPPCYILKLLGEAGFSPTSQAQGQEQPQGLAPCLYVGQPGIGGCMVPQPGPVQPPITHPSWAHSFSHHAKSVVAKRSVWEQTRILGLFAHSPPPPRRCQEAQHPGVLLWRGPRVLGKTLGTFGGLAFYTTHSLYTGGPIGKMLNAQANHCAASIRGEPINAQPLHTRANQMPWKALASLEFSCHVFKIIKNIPSFH